MIPATTESNMDRLDDRSLHVSRNGYPSVAVLENMLSYQSSILNLYYQQVNQISILSSCMPSSVPTNISSLNAVAQSCGLPNLHHVSMVHSEHERQVRSQADQYSTATLSHLRGISFPPEESHQCINTTHTRPMDDATCINHNLNHSEGVEIVNTLMRKVDDDSGGNYLAEPQLFNNSEHKLDLSLQHSYQDSGHSKLKISKKQRNSKPQVNKHKKTDSKWHASYEQLKQYKQQHGHTIVPRGYSLNTKLASWVGQ